MISISRMSALSLVVVMLAGPPARGQERPNIVVVIVADALGNADLGYRGSAIKTPHLDALALGGVRSGPASIAYVIMEAAPT